MNWPPDIGVVPYYSDSATVLYHGDCRTILPLLPKVDLVLTDPPWELSGNAIAIPQGGVAPCRQQSRTLTKGAVGQFESEMIVALENQAEHDCFFLCGYKELADVCKAVKPLRGVFAWHKPNGSPAAFYPAKLDLSFIVWTAKKSLIYGHQHWDSMVFSHTVPPAGCFASERFVDRSGKAAHPCQGPISLYSELLRPFEVGLTVLDAYCGTGTTLRAAKDLGLFSIGIEREEKYAEIAARRLAQEVLPLAVAAPELRANQLELV